MPKANRAGLQTLADLTKPGVMIAIGDAAVPIGTYTRTVLTNLNALYGATYKSNVLAHVVSTEVNVTAVTSLVQLGEVDAGFVYQERRPVRRHERQAHRHPGRATRAIPCPPTPSPVTKSCKTPVISQRFVNFVHRAPGDRRS